MKLKRPSLRAPGPEHVRQPSLVLDVSIGETVYSMELSSKPPVMSVSGMDGFLVVEDWNKWRPGAIKAFSLSEKSKEDPKVRAAWDALIFARSEILSRVSVEGDVNS